MRTKPDGRRVEDTDGPDSYDYLTIMDGPGVDGLGKVWFGYYGEPWKQMDHDTGEITVQARPVKHIPLPRPMTRPEIEEWADEEWCWRVIEQFT